MNRLALLLLVGCGRVAFDPVGDADAAFACPPEFVEMGPSCYRANHYALSADGKPFVDAEALCEAQGGHLVVIDDAAEVAAIQSLTIPGTDYWIGISELAQTGVYRTVLNDVATYLPWASGEPDSGVDHCVNFTTTTGLFADNVCSSPDDVLCEYDGRQPVPAAWGQ